MKTTILSLLIMVLSLMGCKKEAKTNIKVQSTEVAPPLYTIDNTKPAGSLRVLVKPLCYDDLNLAYLKSVKGGC